MKKLWLNRKGFTLIELLVVVAILAVLVAIAIPQYVNFLARTRRAEAYVISRAVHTGQTAYLASHDHYLQVCGFGIPNCTGTTQYERDSEKSIGLEIDNITPLGFQQVSANGYNYEWGFDAAENDNYEFRMIANLKDDESIKDTMFIAAGDSTWLNIYVTTCHGEPGVPLIIEDDITNFICP